MESQLTASLPPVRAEITQHSNGNNVWHQQDSNERDFKNCRQINVNVYQFIF